jgi:hypothetical protein
MVVDRPSKQIEIHPASNDVSIIQASEDEGEKGLLDYQEEIEEAGAALSAALQWINDETVTVGEKIQGHTARVKQMQARGGAVKASDIKRIMLMAASDMNAFSKRIEGVLPDFERSVKTLDASLTALVSLADPESSNDAKEVSTVRTSLSEMLDNIKPAKISLIGFRDSALGLSKLKLSKEYD